MALEVSSLLLQKKELSAVDTVKHEFNISLNELEQRRDSLLQDIKLHSDRVCTQEGAVQKWQEHDGKIKSTLKEIQRCESKEKFDKMKVKVCFYVIRNLFRQSVSLFCSISSSLST